MPLESKLKEDLIDALRRHVNVLSVEIGERSSERGDGLDRAEAYLCQAFQAAGYDVTEQDYDYNGRRVANLIAEHPRTPKEDAPYIVGAHYDTVVGTPGADDNASAVAVMLELARFAASMPNAPPIKFVAFTLEEPPNFGGRHQGSRVFIRDFKNKGGTVGGAIILEMVGLTTPEQNYPIFLKWAGYPTSGDFIGVVGNRASRAFGRRVLDGMRRNSALPVESLFVWFDGWVLFDTRLSDHSSFWDEGYPALMITDTAYFRNRNYHGPGDRAETLDYAFMAELVWSLKMAIDKLTSE